jgi:hypothetical protein
MMLEYEPQTLTGVERYINRLSKLGQAHYRGVRWTLHGEDPKP